MFKYFRYEKVWLKSGCETPELPGWTAMQDNRSVGTTSSSCIPSHTSSSRSEDWISVFRLSIQLITVDLTEFKLSSSTVITPIMTCLPIERNTAYEVFVHLEKRIIWLFVCKQIAFKWFNYGMQKYRVDAIRQWYSSLLSERGVRFLLIQTICQIHEWMTEGGGYTHILAAQEWRMFISVPSFLTSLARSGISKHRSVESKAQDSCSAIHAAPAAQEWRRKKLLQTSRDRFQAALTD